MAIENPTVVAERMKPAGFFSPDSREHSFSFGGRVTWKRLLMRIGLTLLLLALADSGVAAILAPSAVYEHDYRLPQTLPTGSLAGFAASVHNAARTPVGGPVIAFVGASPTWGHRIKQAANTFPAAFSAAGRRAGWPNRSYNFASNGQFLGDEYFIAKGVSEDADAVFIQLTYHTFNSEARDTHAVRYPEIPDLLHLDVTPDEAEILGVAPTTNTKIASRAGAILGRYWLLWRERDSLDRKLFGGKPQNLFGVGEQQPSRLTSLPAGDDVVSDGEFARFDQLDEMKRIAVITRYAERSSFVIDENDTDVRFLRQLSTMLASKGKKAVFFMAPLNRKLVTDYELIDPKQYSANVAVLRAAVTAPQAGFLFLDYNTGPARLPDSCFADISHTTDAGGRAVGALLYRDTWRYLGARQP